MKRILYRQMNAKLPKITRARYSGTGGRGCVFFLFSPFFGTFYFYGNLKRKISPGKRRLLVLVYTTLI
jgi:hypothetical protein